MTTDTHTPGPWAIKRHESRIGWSITATDERKIPFVLGDCWKERDARLIAAAPDLLAALERLMDFAVEASAFIQSVDATNNDESGYEYAPSPEQVATFAAARDAIAKARA